MKVIKGQTAFEFMVVVIFVLAFLAPMWIYLYQIQSETNDQFALSYAKNAVTQIAKRADLVYSQRMDACVEIEAYIPPSVEFINISGNEISMRLHLSSGETDVFAVSIAPMQGSLSPNEGLYNILIKAEGDYVNVTLA